MNELFIRGMWGEEDSNLRSRRQQIYSLPHLAALESPRLIGFHTERTLTSNRSLSLLTDSNRRPTDYKSVALPAELRRQYLLSKELQIYHLFLDCATFFLHFFIFLANPLIHTSKPCFSTFQTSKLTLQAEISLSPTFHLKYVFIFVLHLLYILINFQRYEKPVSRRFLLRNPWRQHHFCSIWSNVNCLC